MINRLELALMLLLLAGSLMSVVLITKPREGAMAAADPLAVAEAPSAQAAETAKSRVSLPSFDMIGFGLLPDLAPHFAPGQP